MGDVGSRREARRWGYGAPTTGARGGARIPCDLSPHRPFYPTRTGGRARARGPRTPDTRMALMMPESNRQLPRTAKYGKYNYEWGP